MAMLSTGYNGNPLIKKARQRQDWTADQIEEYTKCALDPIYFAERYMNIIHVDDGMIPIKLYDYQKEIIDKFRSSRRVAVCTSRQAGKTTTATAIILHFILFNEHKTVVLLANKGEAAREILDRIQLSYENLPKWLQQGVVEWNKGKVELENGCKVFAAATSSDSVRGKSAAMIYIDEAAFVEGWDEFFSSTYPTISSGKKTKLLLTSTPNGLNHFYKTCMGAKEKKNGYGYVEVPWYKIPGRDEAWRIDTMQAIDFDEEKFNQEYCCEFMGSSGTLIAGWKLKELASLIPLVDRMGITQYVRPIPLHNYVCIVDVSRGKGLDYSAFQIIDVTTMPYIQVCTYRDNMSVPTDYAETVHLMCITYNTCPVLVEINDIGGEVADLIQYDYEYENILYTESAGRVGKRITSGFGKNVDKGIRTTTVVKSIGCSLLKLLVEQNQLILNDFNTISELTTFSRKGKSYEAEPGCHDDLVMGLVLFAWLTGQPYFKEFTDINTLMKLRERSEEQIMEDLLPFGFVVSGEEVLEENPIHEGGFMVGNDW